MKIGFIGLGKLGFPVAAAIATRHDVVGYDLSRIKLDAFAHEMGPQGTSFMEVPQTLTVAESLVEAVRDAEIVFVAVQTPHRPEFEGITPLPRDRADFDSTYLRIALADVASCVKPATIVAVVSTILPGTLRSILPRKPLRVVYNPAFIAMGTVQRDFLQPEFVLLGGDDIEAVQAMARFYETLTDAPCARMSIESAELTKVAYNTVISQKVALANVLGQICHELPGADVDAVTFALSLATRRIVSSAYTSAGMGDGGGCHPRDNIAMSWLARELGLHHDPFEQAMVAREEHARWLATMLAEQGMPTAIIGTAYKPGSAIETGSHALLVANILEREFGLTPQLIDPFARPREWAKLKGNLPVAAYLIGCSHERVIAAAFPRRSVVIDPYRYIQDQPGIRVIRIGDGLGETKKTRLSRAG